MENLISPSQVKIEQPEKGQNVHPIVLNTDSSPYFVTVQNYSK